MLKNKVTRVRKKRETPHKRQKKQVTNAQKIDALLESANSIRKADPQKALNLAKRSLLLARKIAHKKGIADSYLYMAYAYGFVSKFSEAREYYKKAIKLYKETKDQKGQANSLMGIGIISTETGDYKQALAYYIRAIRIFETTSNHEGMARTLNNMGVLCSRMNEPKKGIEYFLQALKIHEAMKDHRNIAVSHLNVGANYYEIGKHNKALHNFQKSMRIFKRIKDKKGCALCYQNLGEFYVKQDDDKNAFKYISRAIELFDVIGDKYGLARSNIILGQIYLRSNEYDAALSRLQISQRCARESNAKDVQIEAHENLARLFEEKGDYKQALNHHRHYYKLSQEVFNATKSKQIAAMRTLYETEKKEREAEISQLRNVKLRKEVKQRKRAEKELRKHRDHLEQLVEERTAELRSLAHELSLVEERQRRKIATYLHDDISQTLALATTKLETLKKESSVTKIKHAIEEIQGMTDQANQRTRSLTFEISPPVLYDLGLEPALEWLAEQFGKKHGIKCGFHTDGLVKTINDDAKVILFQSVRELLANVAKHAQARCVKVCTMRDNNTIRIEVEDDGVGFDRRIAEHKTTKSEGFGLFNLKERLRHLRGELEISSKLGHGTLIVLVAPLQSSPKTSRNKK